MKKDRIILKPGKEKAIRNRHHWIFSGAIAHMPRDLEGDILSVFSDKGELLGSAYFNSKASLCGRMLCFDDSDPIQAVELHLNQAIKLRTQLFAGKDTTAYRLVNGEGDLLPGLIVDKYADVLVIQMGTLGMEKLKPWLVEYFKKTMKPEVIYEKSHLPSRKEEGLNEIAGFLYGTKADDVEIYEYGLKYKVSFVEGQKTGFFLDQREMRKLIRNLSFGKRILNCFAYTGGFSVNAFAGGAQEVSSVEISDKAIKGMNDNMELNGFTDRQHTLYKEDVFQFLRENPLNDDVVILDPPAFVKRQKDIVAGCRGYKDINRLAMQKMPADSFLLTCSCSYHVDEQLFTKVVFQASVEAGRTVKIISRHTMAEDHPINICHPESQYLKGLLLYIT